MNNVENGYLAKSITHHILYSNMFAAMFVNLKWWIPIRSTTKKTHDRGMGKPFLMGCGTCCD